MFSAAYAALSRPPPVLSRVLALIAALALSACATRPTDPAALRAYEETNDKWEPFNRTMFDVDQALDAALVRPVAWTYRKVTPDFMRHGVTNVLDNVRSPITFVNDLLQGQGNRAGITLWRLIVNSTIGIGGLFDVAKSMGAP